MTPGEAFPLDALCSALTARGAHLSATGSGTWKHAGGEVDIAPLMEAGALTGLDFHVPYRETTTLVDAVAAALLELAQEHGVRATDPQRNDTVSLAGLSALDDEYLRLGRYAGEYGGVSEALGLSTSYASVDDTSGLPWWPWALLVFVLTLWGAFKVFSPPRSESPGEVHLSPKIRGQ
jgi:hypothetical protein